MQAGESFEKKSTFFGKNVLEKIIAGKWRTSK